MNANAGKTVVITGAAHGLGKALANAFFRKGYDLALLDIDEKGLTELEIHNKSLFGYPSADQHKPG